MKMNDLPVIIKYSKENVDELVAKIKQALNKTTCAIVVVYIPDELNDYYHHTIDSYKDKNGYMKNMSLSKITDANNTSIVFKEAYKNVDIVSDNVHNAMYNTIIAYLETMIKQVAISQPELAVRAKDALEILTT